MKKFCILYVLIVTMLLTMAFCGRANATCTVQCPVTQDNAWNYVVADHFQWSSYDQDVHMLLGYSGALVIGEALIHYGHVRPWVASLVGTIALGLIGTTKEVMFDTYTGRTDIKTYWAGALSGGLTVIALHF